MIIKITGNPGSGKTFLAVHTLMKNFFFWHNKDKQFYRKEDKKKYTIFTNIKGFKPPHKNLNEIFENVPFDKFFTPDYQEKMHKKYPHCVYVLDEVYDYLPAGYRNKDVIKYFATHRHYGDKIYIITQDSGMMSSKIIKLAELEYRAVKSTFSLLGEFRYNVKSNGVIFKRESIRLNRKRIFDLYESFQGDDQQKQSNPLKWVILILIFSFVGLGYLFYDMITPDESHLQASEQVQKPQPEPQKLTTFKNEIKPVQPVVSKPINPEIDLSQIRAFHIRTYVERSGRLFMYECPITGRLMYETESIYNIQKSDDRYYVLISLLKYQQLKKESATFH